MCVPPPPDHLHDMKPACITNQTSLSYNIRRHMHTYMTYDGISRHTVVCQQPRNQKYAKLHAGTPVCYLRDRSSSRFQPIITQKLWHLFLQNLHILVSSYIVPYIPNLKEIAPAVPEIQVPETCQIFFVFFLFLFFLGHNQMTR